jgi:pimeloyl-ACP methyl ester carboxylesterase
LIALPVALALLGLGYETVMRLGDAQRFPPVGQLIDIGGRSLHIHCVGSGPTVVLEAGHGGTSLDWTLVQTQLADRIRVCAYDRAGSGWSDPAPLPRTPEAVTADLHALLQAAGEPGPYTLVAHSLGGRYARLFAAQHPELVSGMVLVDARSEHHDQALTAEALAAMEAQSAPNLIQTLLQRFGLMRLVGPQLLAGLLPGFANLPADVQQAFIVLGARPETQAATGSELAARQANDEQLAAATLGDRPLQVLVAQQTLDLEPTWLPGQEQQAALSSNSTLTVLNGGHYLQFSNPDEVSAAIAEAIRVSRSE